MSEDVIHQYRIEARARATQQLHDLARTAGLSAGDYSGIVVHGDATRNIVEHEEKYRCDLIVMGKHGTHVTEELEPSTTSFTFECMPADDAYKVGCFVVTVPFEEIVRVEIFAVHPDEKPEDMPSIKGFASAHGPPPPASRPEERSA